MSAADFLQAAREQHTATVRILLMGHSDLDAALAAMSPGSLLRSLLKPCTREILQKTLLGSMRTLPDVLAVVDPAPFDRVGHLKEPSLNIRERLTVRHLWQLKYAALASQLGQVALSDTTLRKMYHEATLSHAEPSQVGPAARPSPRKS